MNAPQRIALIGIALFLWLSAPCMASDQGRQFLTGLEAYKAGDYKAAVEAFSAIARSGVANGGLYYNLGNACLKAGQLGPAIVWYERALKFMPGDPDLRFNLKYARSLTRDAAEAGPSPLLRVFFFWKYRLSPRAVVISAIACNLLFWLLIGAWRFTRRRGWVRAALVVAVPVCILTFTGAYDYFEAGHLKQAIILPEQVAVRAGLEDSATELFVLHAGAKVRVIRTLKDHYQIRFSEDKIGWVRQDAAGVI